MILRRETELNYGGDKGLKLYIIAKEFADITSKYIAGETKKIILLKVQVIRREKNMHRPMIGLHILLKEIVARSSAACHNGRSVA